MKIGILTYHWVPNYGANLQTLSTYNYYKNRGLNPIIINWIPEDTKSYYIRTAGVEQCNSHYHFMQSECEMTHEFSNVNHVDDIINEYGITHVVIGSDSVFNISKPYYSLIRRKHVSPTSDHIFPNLFWGRDMTVPHAALSVSCQNAEYSKFYSVKNEIKDALQGFCYISSRDNWTRDMVEYFTDGETVPIISPDPVFAFNTNVKEGFVEKGELLRKYNLPEKYVLFTFNKGRMKAPEQWLSQIKKKFNDAGFCCVYLPKSTGGQVLNLDKKIDFPISPLDWYYIIKYSSGYIGVLMHPIVVCLHNAVPFYSFDHYGTGPILFANKDSSKIYHILKKCDMLNNHFFLKNHLLFPNPEEVFDKVANFSYNKASMFSKSQEKDCLRNFESLTDELFNSK